MDSNGDGMVDRKEAARMRGLSSSFEQADMNRDGKLDPTEFSAAQAMMK
jgi:hypothetical protein